MQYSDKVMDHFLHPRNVGEIEDASGVGEVGNAKCGDIMKIFLDVEDDIIKDVKFQTFGCGSAIASSSMATELIKGKSIHEALALTNKAVAEALQSMWENELGVTVTLNNQEWAAFLQTRKDGDYSIARNGWIADYNDPISFLDMWMTGGGNNDAQYANDDYDALIKQAKTTTDNAERMDLLHQAEDKLIGEDSVLAPLYFYTQKYMLADGIEGMYYCPLGYFFFGYTHQA